jgi:predicted enzyme related to lactoylglutathione lyase
MKMTEYPAGVPCWVELATKDLAGAKAFYGGLFGWEAETSEDPAAGGYTMFRLGGEEIAGGMGLMTPEQATAWTSYVSVKDVDETAEAVTRGGGSVLVLPTDVLDVGRMGVFVDPAGAVFAGWQPRAHRGASLVNEPGTLCWTELVTRDTDGAKAFYSSVFGWGHKTSSFIGTATATVPEYTEWQVGDRSVAGMRRTDENLPPHLPAHWMVYFAVADHAAAAAKVTELGGTVPGPPTTIPVGTFALCSDPQGAFFSIIQLDPAYPRAAG